MKEFRLYAPSAILALLVGLYIYTFLRPTSIRLFDFYGYVGVKQWFLAHRQLLAVHLPNEVIFSMPFALWHFALNISLLQVWRRELKTLSVRICFFSTLIATGVLVEFLQLFHIMRGTFDWNDLMYLSLSSTIIIILFTHEIKKQS